MGRRQRAICCLRLCSLVSLQGRASCLFHGLTGGVFCDISVVVGLHFLEEDLSLGGLAVNEQVVVEQINYLFALVCQFLFYDFLVVFGLFSILRRTFFVFLALNK